MAKDSRTPEADLVARAGADLEADGWSLYYEVSVGYGCARADAVATRLGLLMVLEAKMALTFDVLAQAMDWRRRAVAHRVACIVPEVARRHRSSGRSLAYDLAARLGLGIATMPPERTGGRLQWRVAPETSARINAKPLREFLHEGLKVNRPGQNARYWTPFRDTVARLERWVAANPGATIKEAVAGMEEHHYANDRSARQCLLKAVHLGLCDAIELREKGNSLQLWPRSKAT